MSSKDCSYSFRCTFAFVTFHRRVVIPLGRSILQGTCLRGIYFIFPFPDEAARRLVSPIQVGHSNSACALTELSSPQFSCFVPVDARVESRPRLRGSPLKTPPSEFNYGHEGRALEIRYISGITRVKHAWHVDGTCGSISFMYQYSWDYKFILIVGT